MLISVLVATIFKFIGSEGGNTVLLILAAIGAVMGVCNVLFAANGSILAFIFGLADVVICCIILWDSGVMGNFAMHLFYFLPMQFVGWWQWKKRGAKESLKEEDKVKARRFSAGTLVLWTAIYLAGAVALFFILLEVDLAKGLEPDYMKIAMDAAIVAGNIVGQILMSWAYMDQWYFWILVDVCSVVLWARLLGTQAGATYALVNLVKYAFYLLNACNGLRMWWRMSREEAAKQ